MPSLGAASETSPPPLSPNGAHDGKSAEERQAITAEHMAVDEDAAAYRRALVLDPPAAARRVLADRLDGLDDRPAPDRT
jgi:hypothetical protein